jgi:hypothetical protein
MRCSIPCNLGLLSFLTCVVTYGAVAPQLSLESLIDRSQVIVEGEVLRSSVAWDPTHKYIWTHYEVAVSDTIRGSGSSITVSEPGGTLDGTSQAFSATLHYEAGEHVLLFLFRTPVGYWRTTGGVQGKFALSADGVVTSQASYAVVPAIRSAVELGAGASGIRLGSLNISLAEFKSQVRELARSRTALEVR